VRIAQSYAKSNGSSIHKDDDGWRKVVVNHGSFDKAVEAIRPLVSSGAATVVVIHSDGWSSVSIPR
jgi:hypothetical protein